MKQHSLCLLALVFAAGCRFEPATVTRVSDGVATTGRYVRPEAYAAYAKGVVFEARGALAQALEAYEAALDEDPDAPEVLARIGAVHCLLSKKPTDGFAHAARMSFTRALSLDPESGPAWLERARCARLRGRREEALSSALKAASVDPRSNAAALLVIDTAEESGRADLAQLWLDALVVDAPVPRATWLKLAAFAAHHRDDGRLFRARRGLRELGAGEPPELVLEDAFASGDLEAARRAAIELRLTPGRLAVRAARAGALPIARAQGELVLAADPDDSDAWIALLLSASLEPGTPALAELIARAPTEPTPPSEEAALALREVVARLAGSDAAKAIRATASD